MPEAATEDPGVRTSTKEEVTTQEIYLQKADDQSGPVDADITHPPMASPVSLYANLQEWPLARLSVQLRHIGVLLRVTLYRRAAELNFRGVDFRHLPREVMRSICNDFNHIGGELARRLASLFPFLKPAPGTDTQADRLGLSLYAEPAYWLYGLLSFCAKACESKIEEANGAPVLRAKEEGGAPATKATGRTKALMQTVVMSFGRNQSLGKPDLPIHHLHVYFTVQLVHKLVERMKTWLLTGLGSLLKAQLAVSGQKRYFDCHPSAPPPELLSTRIPRGPCGQKGNALCDSVAQCHIGG